MVQSRRILIVDDDIKLRNLLKKFLNENSFEVSDAENTIEADGLMNKHDFDLMILDMMMPGENGLDFCKRLRMNLNQIPIIMLSARGDDIDKIIGLEIGVDDYLSKPFNPRELVARIKAILRRNPVTDKQIHNSKQYQIGETSFDIDRRQLIDHKLQSYQLTSTEYDLLKVFVENPGKALSRDQLMQLLHAKDFEVFDRSIDVLVSRLRKLVEVDSSQPQHIKTVWGVGYVFVSSA